MYQEVYSINIGEQELPIRMNNLVIQKIQETYGSVTSFEMKLMGWSQNDEGKIIITGEPSAAVMNDVLPMLVKEGFIAKYGEQSPYTEEEIIRMINVPPLRVALGIHDELCRAFERKKKPKEKTKNQTGKSTGKSSILSGLRKCILQKR